VDRDSGTHLTHSKILLAVRSKLLTGYSVLKLKWIHKKYGLKLYYSGPHQSLSQNTPIFYLYNCFSLFPLHYSCPTNHPTQLGYPHTLLTPLQLLSCLLYTLSISHYLICSTQYYRVMSMCGAKQNLNPL